MFGSTPTRFADPLTVLFLFSGLDGKAAMPKKILFVSPVDAFDTNHVMQPGAPDMKV